MKKRGLDMIEAVILDWAGTTVDYGSFSPIYAFEKTFQTYGITPTIEEIREPMGMLKIDHIRTMLKMDRLTALWREKYKCKPTETDVLELYKVFQDEVFQVLEEYSTLKPQVVETVQILRERKIKIGSTTGYTNAMMEIVTKKAADQGYKVDYWVTPDMTNAKGRPYPYMIFRNLEYMGISSVRNVVKIGDTVSDIAEGKNAGVTTIGVIDGSSIMGMKQADFESLLENEKKQKRQAVQKVYQAAGADYTIENFGQLPELLSRIEKGNA